jgi:hypothetical protein
MNANKQSGASMLGIATAILIIGGIAFIGIKVSPIYFEFYKVDAAIANLAAQPDTGTLSNGKVRNELLKRLGLDDVNGVKRDNISVKRKDEIMFLKVEYEKRNSALESLDLVGKYEKTVEIKIPEL